MKTMIARKDERMTCSGGRATASQRPSVQSRVAASFSQILYNMPKDFSSCTQCTGLLYTMQPPGKKKRECSVGCDWTDTLQGADAEQSIHVSRDARG